MSASSHWRRFVNACAAPSPHTQPGNGQLLRKSPSEWQRYVILLRTCPVARGAVLDQLTPIFVDYFILWWQRNAQSDRPSRAMETPNEILEDLYTAETMLCKLIQLIRELIKSPSVSEQFVTTVCAWCLARLRPICTVPPTQLLAQLRRILQSAAATASAKRRLRHSRRSAKSRTARSKGLKHSSADVSRKRSAKPTVDALARVREGSPFTDGPGILSGRLSGIPASPSDSEMTSDTDVDEDEADEDQDDEDVDDDGGAEDDEDDDADTATAADGEMVDPNGQVEEMDADRVEDASVSGTVVSTTTGGTSSASESTAKSSTVGKDAESWLDFNPDSPANRQLLGSWSRCPPLMDMLQLMYELLLGSGSQLSTVQALLASASIPIPPELNSVTSYHPPPTAVLPHWVITWLTYQSYRLLHAGAPGSIRKLVRSVLESATLLPPSSATPTPNAQAAWAMLDTVAGWYEEKRVDRQFWVSSCLTHLLFLGDETPQLVYQWLMEQLQIVLSRSSQKPDPSRTTGLVHVMLRLGLATVPVPPSASIGSGGTALESTPGQLGPPPGTTGTVTGTNNNSTTSANGAPSYIGPNPQANRFPGPVNYSGFPPHPADLIGGGPAGSMAPGPGGTMRHYYPQSMHRPGSGGAPFLLPSQPPRAMFGAGQPPGRGPHGMPIGPPAPPLPPPPPPPPPSGSLYSSSMQSARLSTPPHLRQHRPRMDQTGSANEWTVCTPTRQPASLLWLLNLAKLLRVATVTALAHALSLFLTPDQPHVPDPTTIFDRILGVVDTRQFSAESPILFHLATEVLLTAPAGSEFKTLLTFLFQTAAHSGSEILPASDQTPESKPVDPSCTTAVSRSVCAALLHSAAVACLSMVHSSSECADSLNRGGCEGLLRAARLLAHPRLGESTGISCRGLLFDLMTGSDSLVALIATQMLVALTLTLEPNLAQEILIELCCCSVQCDKTKSAETSEVETEDVKHSVSSPTASTCTTSLPLFFLVLDELEAGWTSRRVSAPDLPTSEVSWIANDLLSHSFHDPVAYRPSTASAYLVHQLLAVHVLPRLWDLVSRKSDRAAGVLRVVIWLVLRENIMVRNRLARPRLQVALCTQIKALLTLLTSPKFSIESTGLLLTLFEMAMGAHGIASRDPFRTGVTSRAHQSHQAHRPMRYDAHHLAPRLAYRTGQHLVRLAAQLLHRLRHAGGVMDTREKANTVHALARIERLLLPQAVLLGCVHATGPEALLRSTALHAVSTAESLQLVDPDYECEADLAIAERRSRLRDLDVQLINIQHLPVRSESPDLPLSFASSLLLLNPPASSHCADGDDELMSGYLRSPALSRLDRRGSLLAPRMSDKAGELKRRQIPVENSNKNDTVSCPNWLHWLRLIDWLCQYQHPTCGLSRDHLSVCIEWFATGLQQSLLPLGLHLPQTSVWQLPDPIPIVLSPTGVGLERVIRLMHQFCPEVKAGAQRGDNPRIRVKQSGQDSMWLSQSLFTAPLAMLRVDGAHSSVGLSSTEPDEVADSRIAQPLLDPFCLRGSDQWPPVHFPYPRLLLGLLQGLEVAWASPLAPRHSIPDAVSFLTTEDGAYAQGVFPVIGASELCKPHARKLAVDYCQRRVDYHTDLFRFTKRLLMSLFLTFHREDCVTAARTQSEQQTTGTDSSTLSEEAFLAHLPLDRLLYCLTPREMSILLSDVRRNLRLRLAFDWLRRNRWSAVTPTHPLAVIGSKTLEALGGGPVPPSPAFVTPGLLLALLQSHLIEPGVAVLVGPLLTAARLLQPAPPHLGGTSVTPEACDADSVVEEIDVNGELMVVLND